MPSKNISQIVPDMYDRNYARPAFSIRCNAEDLNSPCSIADVFDMEVQLCCDDSGYQCDKQFQQQRARILRALAPGSDFADQICSFINQKIGNTAYAQPLIDHLEQDLESNGFYTNCYTNYGGGQKLWNQLNHKFIVVYQQCLMCESDMVIVDPNFKSQFQIAKATKRYITILNMVPSIVVATLHQIKNLVTYLSKEMSIAFKEQGNSTPPWRSLSSLQSKWKINNTLQRTVSEPLQFFVQGGNQIDQITRVEKRSAGGKGLPPLKIIRAEIWSSEDDKNQNKQMKHEFAFGEKNANQRSCQGRDYDGFVVQEMKSGNQQICIGNINELNFQKFQAGVDKRRSSLPSVSSELSALLRESTLAPTSPTKQSQNQNFTNNNCQNENKKFVPVVRGELFKAIEGQQSRTN